MLQDITGYYRILRILQDINDKDITGYYRILRILRILQDIKNTKDITGY
jgi:hypothetical protein